MPPHGSFGLGRLPEEFGWVNRLEKHAANPILWPQGEWAADMIFNSWSVSSLIWAWGGEVFPNRAVCIMVVGCLPPLRGAE